MAHQQAFEIRTRGRGMHDIRRQVETIVRAAGSQAGVAHVFAQHTSCAVVITENADPDVHTDLETLAARWAPDADRAYLHDAEGSDDMAAHARSILSGTSVSVPVADGALLLGLWQGLYLWEHRGSPHARTVVVTVVA